MRFFRLLGSLTIALLAARAAAAAPADARAESAPGADAVIAPQGVDSPGATLGVDCTLQRPCRTLTKARDVVAAAIERRRDRNYRILLRGGVYYLGAANSDQSAGESVSAGLTLTARDTVDDGFEVAYAGYPGETAVISGGRDLSPAAGQKWTLADMAGTPVWTTFIAEVADGRQQFSSIWVNDQRAGWTEKGAGGYSLALEPFRMTEDGSLTAPELARPTYAPDMIQPGNDGDRSSLSGHNVMHFKRGACAAYPSKTSTADLCSTWSDVGAIRIVLAGANWYWDMFSLRSIDDPAGAATLNGIGGVKQGGLFKNQTWWRRNVCEDLPDSPGGTMYLVRAAAKSACGFPSGTLIYKPRPGETLENTQIIAPLLNHLVAISNSPAADRDRGSRGAPSNDKKVGNTVFENLTFAHSNSTIYSNFPSPAGRRGGFVGGGQYMIYGGSMGAITGVGATGLRIDRSTLKHFAEGAFILPGGSHASFTNNRVYDVGGAAFGAGEDFVAGSRAYSTGPHGTAPSTANRHSSGNLVYNNDISDCGRLLIGVACVSIANGHDNTIAFNSLSGVGNFGVAIGGSAGEGLPGKQWSPRPWTMYQPNQYNNYVGYNRLDSIGSLIDRTSGRTTQGAAQGSDWGALYNNQAHCGANQPTSGYVAASGADAGAPTGMLVEYNYFSNIQPGKWPVADNTAATGSIAFSANPTPGQSVTIAGTAITFVASGARGHQSNIGRDLAATLANLVKTLSSLREAGPAQLAYSARGDALIVRARYRGPRGNELTLAASNARVSGPTLAGGANKPLAKGGGDGVPIYFDTNASACVTISKNIVANVKTNRILQLTGHLFEVKNNIFWQDFVWDDGSPRLYARYPSSGPLTLVESVDDWGRQYAGLQQTSFHHNVLMLGGGSRNVAGALNYPLWRLAKTPAAQAQTYRFFDNVYCNLDARGDACLPMDRIQAPLNDRLGDYPLTGSGETAWTTTMGQDAGSTFNVLPTCPDAARGDFSTCSAGMPKGFDSPYSPAPPGSRYPGKSVADAGARPAAADVRTGSR